MIRQIATIVAFAILMFAVFGHEGGGAVGVVVMLWLTWLLIRFSCRVIRGAYRAGRG